jgi:hypothetical protein
MQGVGELLGGSTSATAWVQESKTAASWRPKMLDDGSDDWGRNREKTTALLAFEPHLKDSFLLLI